MGIAYQQSYGLVRLGVVSAICLVFAGSGMLQAETMHANPIGKVARLFNPRLVKVEDRVEFLSRQLMSLTTYEEHALKTGIGCRGARVKPGDPDPTVTIDLGREFPIEALYLVPLQQESSARNGLFPKRFTIEFSEFGDFRERRILYTSGDSFFPETGGMPVRFAGQGAMARYVKMTVNQGHLRGKSEIFGMSELVVISDGYPVSFGCKATAVGGLEVKDLWYPGAITDGRMPLGVWQGGDWSKNGKRGDLIVVDAPDEQVSWTMDFGSEKILDLLVLFPFDVREVLEAGILPEELEIQVRDTGGGEFRTVEHWKNPMPGTNHETPLLFKLGGVSAREIRINGIRSREVGDRFLYGISEIQLWADQENVAKGIPVIREGEGGPVKTNALTNGYGSERQIIPVGSWLSQLHERWRVEREIEALQPIRAQMASESELNATWGSAMMLGLTFLIPVFIVERRRLISKNQVDQLRKRIASDLHDDFGSNLGSISLIARTARKDLVRLHGPEEVGEDLDEVESIARESSLAMRDIVWLLERKQDSIGDLVHRMRETASRLLRGFDYTIECESSKSASKLSLDAKRHLFLFYKEAVHNILKHSGATKVSIRLWDQGDKLVLEVIDNGHGLPMVVEDGKEVPRLVRKLDERARVLEGKLDMISEKDKATTVLLTVKRSLVVAATQMK